MFFNDSKPCCISQDEVTCPTSEQTEQTLSPEEISRQDFVDGQIYQMLHTLAPNRVQDRLPQSWDIEVIASVRDVIENIFVENNICTKKEFYPSIPLG
jgi:hypothetical protein